MRKDPLPFLTRVFKGIKCLSLWKYEFRQFNKLIPQLSHQPKADVGKANEIPVRDKGEE